MSASQATQRQGEDVHIKYCYSELNPYSPFYDSAHFEIPKRLGVCGDEIS